MSSSLIALVLMVSGLAPAAHSIQLPDHTDFVLDARPRLGDRAATLLVTNKLTGARHVIQLHAAADAVREVRVAPAGRAIVISQTAAAECLDIVELHSGAVLLSSTVSSPSISPDSRHIAFERFLPRTHPRPSAEYRLVSIGEEEKSMGGAPGVVLFPLEGSGRHTRHSAIQWVAPAVFAFLDFSEAAGSVSVVAARVTGPSRAAVATQSLPTEELVNTREVDSGAPPAAALFGAEIRRTEGEGMTLRIKFTGVQSVLKRPRVEVRMW